MLGRPFQLPCGLTLKNRLVKASMTERMANSDGSPSERLIKLFTAFAEGGAGLLMTGNVPIDGRQMEAFGNVTWDTLGRDIKPFARWSASGLAQETPVVMQLNHPGRQAMRSVVASTVGPSAVGLPNSKYFAVPRALEEREILEIIEQFGVAARSAERSGFAGVEIHAAHGYLLSQFLSANVNRRSDRWGGSLNNRSRLLLNVVERVRMAVAKEFAVSVKLNAGDFVIGGLEPQEATDIVRGLDKMGVDFVEISGGTFERPASFGYGLPDSTLKREGYFLELARRVRDATTLPLMVTGGFRSGAAMDAALRSGACDLIGLARPLAIEPDLPRRLLSDPGAEALIADIRLPKEPLASLAELYWYREQLERIAKGRVPRVRGSGMLAILRRLPADKALAWSRRRFMDRTASQSVPI